MAFVNAQYLKKQELLRCMGPKRQAENEPTEGRPRNVENSESPSVVDRGAMHKRWLAKNAI